MTSYSISDIIGIIQIRDIELNYHQSMVYINESLRQYSHDIKKEIDKQSKSWEKYKKYSNPYEFINTSFDNNTMPICSYKPLSRSYFKMIKVARTIADLQGAEEINVSHMAEALQYRQE